MRQHLFRLVLMLPLMCGAALVPHARADDGKDLPLFQDLIDATEENGILIPPPGVYRGPVMIDYPLTIEGGGQVTIDNGGEGSVIYVDSDGVTIKGLRLTGSGISYNDIDAGVQIRGNFNIVKDCVIDDCLFGIDLQMCEHCIIRRNTISSKIEMDLGQRGDGVRLWYSFHNKIEDNVCTDVRDMVVWYSSENEITGNSLSGSRYSLHFMYSKYNLVENNEYYQNAVGIFLMYSDGIIVRNNSIAHAVGPTGVGIGFKETSKLTIENNKILYCASGLYIDVSPYDPETTNQFTANLIAYNGIGVRFLNDWQGNHFRENHFVDNMTQVFVGGGGTANRNIWEGNHWSDYQGFDRDKDGVGDTPHEVFAYADRIWQDNHYAQFFKGSPLLETIDLLERLAPFSAPDLVVRDSIPRIREAAISPPVENSDLP